MSEKNINSRIQHKHDIEANWLKATNFIPKAGEIIVYDVDDENQQPRLKIGDGETNVNNLTFLGKNIIVTEVNEVLPVDGDYSNPFGILKITKENYVPVEGDILYLSYARNGVGGSYLGDNSFIQINNLDPIPIKYHGQSYYAQSNPLYRVPDPADSEAFLGALYIYLHGSYQLISFSEMTAIDTIIRNFFLDFIQEQIMSNPDNLAISFSEYMDNYLSLIGEAFIANTPNWDASDDMLGRILNRTHYDSMEYAILDQPLIYDSNYFTTLDTYIPVEIGETLIVNFDGTDYNCIVREAPSDTGEIPREYIAGVAGVTTWDEFYPSLEETPFTIIFFNSLGFNANGFGISIQAYGDCRYATTFSLKKKKLKKLDSKFLPDEIPHTKKGKGKIILPTTQLTYNDEHICALEEPHISLVPGKEYVVTWGDSDYYCTAISLYFEGMPLIGLGNTGFLNGQDSGEPFAIGAMSKDLYPDSVIAILAGYLDSDYAASTFSICESKEVICGLEGKFLPEGTPYAELKTVFHRTHITATIEDGIAAYNYPNYISMDVGKKYIVNWNGTDYECESYLFQPVIEANPVIVLGDMAAKNYPFAIAFDISQLGFGMIVLPFDGLTDFPLSITLPPKYQVINSNLLPEGVPHTERSRKVILQETRFKQDSDLGLLYGIPELISILPGEKYIVNYNGTEYECLGAMDVIDDSALPKQSVYLGDINETNDFPFILMATPPEDIESMKYGVIVYAYDTSQPEIIISISKTEETIHKLDSKYLPDEEFVIAPPNLPANTLLMFNGTDWVGISKADLIAEIIAALPAAEGGSF